MASLIDKVKRALGQIVVPVFAVDDTPPAFEDGDARPGQLDKTTGGIKVHVVGGGGGDATAAKQDEQTGKIEEIADQGRPGTTLGLLRFTATASALRLDALDTPRGLTIQVVSNASDSVWIGTADTVTVGGSNRGWEILPGAIEWFDVANANQLWCIAASSVDCTARREVRP